MTETEVLSGWIEYTVDAVGKVVEGCPTVAQWKLTVDKVQVHVWRFPWLLFQ